MLLLELVVRKAEQDLLYKKIYNFDSSQRIPSKEGFANCLKSKYLISNNFKLFFLKNEKSNARLGIIVSKKCIKKATERNSNKRAIREIFRKHTIKSKKIDLIVLIRHSKTSNLAKQSVELNTLFDSLVEKCL